MPEIVKVLTDDHGTITHLLTAENESITVDELAGRIEAGKDYFVTFGNVKHLSITIVAEDGRLEPTVDDPRGEYSIWDLPQGDDPAEEEFEVMYDRMDETGEFDDEADDEDLGDDLNRYQ